LAGFQNRARFSTWLYSVVMNHIRNRLRHNRVLQVVPLENNNSDEEEKWIPEIAEKNQAFDEVLDKRLQLEAVRAAVAKFPPAYRTIFILHYFQDLPLKEIAEKLNRPLGTVKAYLHRARKLLNGLEAGFSVEEPCEAEEESSEEEFQVKSFSSNRLQREVFES
jgi:RNA polymerase sigma factor (sigma-70 family)